MLRQTLRWLRYLRETQPSLFYGGKYVDAKGRVVGYTPPPTVSEAVEILKRCGYEQYCQQMAQEAQS